MDAEAARYPDWKVIVNGCETLSDCLEQVRLTGTEAVIVGPALAHGHDLVQVVANLHIRAPKLAVYVMRDTVTPFTPAQEEGLQAADIAGWWPPEPEARAARPAKPSSQPVVHPSPPTSHETTPAAPPAHLSGQTQAACPTASSDSAKRSKPSVFAPIADTAVDSHSSVEAPEASAPPAADEGPAMATRTDSGPTGEDMSPPDEHDLGDGAPAASAHTHEPPHVPPSAAAAPPPASAAHPSAPMAGWDVLRSRWGGSGVQRSPAGGHGPVHGRPPRSQSNRPQPTNPRLAAREHARSTPTAPPPRAEVLKQKTVAVWGGKPGSGRSTLVVALADLLSRIAGVTVCTWDLNQQNSSLATMVGKEQEPNSWVLLSESLAADKLGPRAVKESTLPIKPNWDLITGPAGNADWAQRLDPSLAARMLDLIRPGYDYLLMDVSAGHEPVATWALTAAQVVIIAVSAHFPDVLDTARSYERLTTAGILVPERCRLVLTHWLDTPELPATDVAACFDLPVAAQIPLSPLTALQAARTGRPVTQLDSEEAQALSAACLRICGLIVENAAMAELRSAPAGILNWFRR